MQVALWRLADDPTEYGDDAGKFILVTPDGESEPYADVRPFDREEAAVAFAVARGDVVVPLAVPGVAP